MNGGSVTDEIRRFVHAHVEGCMNHYGVGVDSTATTNAHNATTSTNRTDNELMRKNHTSLEDLMKDYDEGLDCCKPLKVRKNICLKTFV